MRLRAGLSGILTLLSRANSMTRRRNLVSLEAWRFYTASDSPSLAQNNLAFNPI